MADISEVVIVLPSLNPDEKLLEVVRGTIDAGFQKIVIVNDGSNPENMHYFDEACKYSQVFLLTHDINLGKGAALKTAFNHLIENDNDFCGVVTVDGDNQHKADDIFRCASAMLESESVVLGVRDFSLPKIPLRSRIGNRITSFVFKTGCGINVSDTQTGLRAIPQKYLKTFCETQGNRFEYETNMLIDIGRFSIPYNQIPIETIYIEGNKTSHFNPVKDSIRIYSQILKYMLSSMTSYIIDQFLFAIANIIIPLFGANGFIQIICATVFARIPSSLFNFLFNKKIVFKNQETSNAFLKYYILCFVQMGISAGLVCLLSHVFSSSSALSLQLFKISGDIVIFIIGYYFQREWVYKRKGV